MFTAASTKTDFEITSEFSNRSLLWHRVQTTAHSIHCAYHVSTYCHADSISRCVSVCINRKDSREQMCFRWRWRVRYSTLGLKTVLRVVLWLVKISFTLYVKVIFFPLICCEVLRKLTRRQRIINKRLDKGRSRGSFFTDGHLDDKPAWMPSGIFPAIFSRRFYTCGSQPAYWARCNVIQGEVASIESWEDGEGEGGLLPSTLPQRRGQGHTTAGSIES